MNDSETQLKRMFDSLAIEWQGITDDFNASPLPCFEETKDAVVVLNRIMQNSITKTELFCSSCSATGETLNDGLVPTTNEEYLHDFATAIGCGFLLQAISAKFSDRLE